MLGDEALAVTELKPKAGFYDYAAKYTDGLTQHVCPAQVPEPIAAAMLDMAARAHRLLGCKGASRSDFRWDEEQGEAGIYLLEVNTQPGMTPLSLVPEQAKLRGIEYGELVERLIEEAVDERGACPARRRQPGEPRKAAPRSCPSASPSGFRSTMRAPTAWPACVPRLPARDRVVALVALDIPAKAERSAGTAVGRAGFMVSGYQIVGLNHLDRARIDDVVNEELHRAAEEAGTAKAPQPLVDVAGIRARLLGFGWIKDARVSRRLPDTLVIDIVERKPAALWQNQGQLALIDAEGVVLDRVPINSMPDLPLLIGPGANRQARELARLMAESPRSSRN